MMTDRVEEGPIIDQPNRAADGGRVPGACNTLGEFVRTLEDGQFDADCYGAIRDLAAKLNEHAQHNGGKSKGKVVITLEFSQEAAISEIRSSFKVTEPVEKRAKSVLWQTEDHRFTRTRPGQHQLFGFRDVTGERAPVRDI